VDEEIDAMDELGSDDACEEAMDEMIEEEDSGTGQQRRGGEEEFSEVLDECNEDVSDNREDEFWMDDCTEVAVEDDAMVDAALLMMLDITEETVDDAGVDEAAEEGRSDEPPFPLALDPLLMPHVA